MQINVNVEEIESIDLATPIETRHRYDEDGDREQYEVTIGHLIAEKVTSLLTRDDNWGGIKRKFMEIRDEEIRKAVEPIVTDAISGPITKTNTYGEPTGATTTLRELIIAEVRKVLDERSDRYNSQSPTRLQKNVADTVRSVVAKELADVLNEEKAKVVAAVRAKGAELIAEAVKQGLGAR